MTHDAEELTDDALTGAFRLWQRRRGQRYSLDDVATAWEAANARPHALRYADLGCGIGSVLLMLAHKLPRDASIVGVEAQAVSHALAVRNVERNGLGDRVQLIHGDLREDLRELTIAPRFDLVTGTPPYMRPGTATPSTDSQRAFARIEMRGGIEDYLQAAAKIVADDGRVVMCCDARSPERALRGAADAGLRAVRQRDVVPRASKKGPLFTVWTFSRRDDGLADDLAQTIVEPALIARDANGGRTEAAHALRRFFDLPVNVAEPPSP